MWKLAASILLFLLGGNVGAQSADGSSRSTQEPCFWAALVEVACSKLPEHSGQRPSCLKARAVQQKCWEQAMPEASAGTDVPLTGAAPLAPPEYSAERPAPQDAAAVAPPGLPQERQGLQGSGPANSPEGSADKAHLDETKSAPKISPKVNSANIDCPAVDKEPVARTDTPVKNDERLALRGGWLVSETSLDNISLATAVIHSTSKMRDSPNTFAVRCRDRRTELMLSTAGAWVTPRGNNVQVDYQINDRRTIRQSWTLSTDGRTVTYTSDPIRLLRSMPYRTTLKVAIADIENVRHEATFQLT
jgi:hypothetical protein